MCQVQPGNEWRDRRAYVIGTGKSGLAAAGWLLGQGATVCLNESRALADLAPESRAALAALEAQGLLLELGQPCDPLAFGAELVVPSPGVPLDEPAIRAAGAAGAVITNEIELGWRAGRAAVVGVTGSNGKTTVTSLIGHMLRLAGREPFVGGNIGVPYLQAAPRLTANDLAVLELSSFQLEGILSLRPKVAVFLNLSPDHLNRHKTYAAYQAAKWRIAEFQGPADWLILNGDDPLLRREGERRLATAAGGGPRIMFFSAAGPIANGLWLDEEGWLNLTLPTADGAVQRQRLLPAAEFALPGAHNRENLLAAAACGLILGLAPADIRRAAATFQAVEHRLEPVGEAAGVLYVNDSKATNPDAALKALDAFTRPLLLIAGGDGKGASFQELAAKIAARTKLAVLIGKDGGRLAAALREAGFERFRQASSLEEAIDICREQAVAGDAVLLSPACSSLDMFRNYEQRGEVFKARVKEILAARSNVGRRD
ncbi:MAG: UDP-N-acetylmuramoyl-L-alanine--D-glutamate ligase [Peptococcaceae bacterium]|jgi:UDP-N-acetylmuramoylalanine--D-glutamate ligase|nr:UDP-N-acetylmuramoyl-L-alanine--D-glutamate ligase [Peptococcaceae bacterium]